MNDVGAAFRELYDNHIYPIIAPPAIAVVKLMTRFVNWMIDNLGENNE